jgi:hypothetical protein
MKMATTSATPQTKSCKQFCTDMADEIHRVLENGYFDYEIPKVFEVAYVDGEEGFDIVVKPKPEAVITQPARE